MKRYICIFVFLFLFLLNASICYADECSSEELKKLKEQVEAIHVDYEFDYDSANMGIFNENIVTVNGITEDIYAILKDHSVGFYFEDSVNNTVIKTVNKTSKSGSDILEFYSERCPGDLLRTVQLDLKKYNYFSNYEECDGIDGSELDVCDSFYEKELTYEDFVKKVENYKNGNKDSSAISSNTNSSILDFLVNHIIWIAIFGVVLIGILIFVILKKFKSYKLD